MVKEEKQENKGYVEFQVFSFTNKIQKLASHLELQKWIFHRKEVHESFWENIARAAVRGGAVRHGGSVRDAGM